jgi:hypothetical protein
MTTRPNPEEKPTLEECLECLRMIADSEKLMEDGAINASFIMLRRAKVELYRILSLAGESEDGS